MDRRLTAAWLSMTIRHHEFGGAGAQSTCEVVVLQEQHGQKVSVWLSGVTSQLTGEVYLGCALHPLTPCPAWCGARKLLSAKVWV